MSGLVFLVYVKKRAAAPIARPPMPVPAAQAARGPLPFKTSKQCIECHTAIGEEWLSSRHAKAWDAEAHPHNSPMDPKRLECSPCHIPQPIYEVGLTQREQVRADRHEEGVDCISCHVRGNVSLGAGPTRDAACNPSHEPTISQSATCQPCHAFHGSLDEWRRSKFFALGQGCQHCHMKKVRRPLVKGGPVRDGHSHRFPGGHSRQLLRQALSVSGRIAAGKVVVTITNDRTGHAVPGEISHRQVILELQLTDAAGRTRTHQTVFQAPPRPKRNVIPTTQIMPGQQVVVSRPLPPGGGAVVARLFYKLYPFYPDEHGTELWRKKLR